MKHKLTAADYRSFGHLPIRSLILATPVEVLFGGAAAFGFVVGLIIAGIT